MADKRIFRDEKLPVTAEVGGEGGSFADPTYQESAMRGIRSPGLPRADASKGTDDTGGEAITSDQIDDGGVGRAPAPAGGMKKHPTE